MLEAFALLILIAFLAFIFSKPKSGGHRPPDKAPEPHRPPNKPSDARRSAIPPRRQQ